MEIPLPIVLTTAAVLTGTGFAVGFYYEFRKRITQTDMSISQLKDEAFADLLPEEFFDNFVTFRFLYERDEIAVPGYQVRQDVVEQHFTQLLRRNMLINRHMPQTWIFWFLLREPEQRRTFTKDHLSSLDFRPGDVICGIFRVVRREPGEVVMKMVPPPSMAAISGLLIVRLRDEMLVSEVVQWMPKSAGRTLPIGRGVGKFLHRIASWWILEGGKKFLLSVREKQ